jgi:hypothetical protein
MICADLPGGISSRNRARRKKHKRHLIAADFATWVNEGQVAAIDACHICVPLLDEEWDDDVNQH